MKKRYSVRWSVRFLWLLQTGWLKTRGKCTLTAREARNLKSGSLPKLSGRIILGLFNFLRRLVLLVCGRSTPISALSSLCLYEGTCQ